MSSRNAPESQNPNPKIQNPKPFLTGSDDLRDARHRLGGPSENVHDGAVALEVAAHIIQAHLVAHGPLVGQRGEALAGSGGRARPARMKGLGFQNGSSDQTTF